MPVGGATGVRYFRCVSSVRLLAAKVRCSNQEARSGQLRQETQRCHDRTEPVPPPRGPSNEWASSLLRTQGKRES